MIFFTHIAFALFLAVLTQKYIGEFGIAFLIAVLVSAAFPDIDIGTSYLGRHFRLLNFFMTHRGITHTILVMMMFTISAYLVTKDSSVAIGSILGYASHLFLDSLTPAGLNIFWPSKLITRGPIRSAGAIDMLLFASFVTLTVLIVIN